MSRAERTQEHFQRIKVAQPQTHLTSSFIGCLTAMTNGDLSAITGDHWGNALRAGGVTAAVATVVAAIGFRMNKWTRALLCGAATFGAEATFKDPTYGTTMSDIYQTALVAGGVAMVLAFFAGMAFDKIINKQ